MHLRLIIALPPTTNHAYATFKGRRILSADGRSYKKDTALFVRYAAAQAGWQYAEGKRLAVSLYLHFPDKRRCDIANREKLAIDSIAEALGFDDTVIDDLRIVRGDMDKAAPRCEVELRML